MRDDDFNTLEDRFDSLFGSLKKLGEGKHIQGQQPSADPSVAVRIEMAWSLRAKQLWV